MNVPDWTKYRTNVDEWSRRRPDSKVNYPSDPEELLGNESFKCPDKPQKAADGKYPSTIPIVGLHDSITRALKSLEQNNCKIIHDFETDNAHRDLQLNALEVNQKLYSKFCDIMAAVDDACTHSIGNEGSQNHLAFMARMQQHLKVNCQMYGDISSVRKTGERYLKQHIRESRQEEVDRIRRLRVSHRTSMLQKSAEMINATKSLTGYLEAYNTHFSPTTAPYQLEVMMPFDIRGNRLCLDVDKINGLFQTFWRKVVDDGEGGNFAHRRLIQILCGHNLTTEEHDTNPLYIALSQSVFESITYNLRKDSTSDNVKVKPGGYAQMTIVGDGDDCSAIVKMKGRVERCAEKPSSTINIWRMQVIVDNNKVAQAGSGFEWTSAPRGNHGEYIPVGALNYVQ